MVAEFLQGSDTGQVCVGLTVALETGSKDTVAEEVFVQLVLQRGQLAEQSPVKTGRQVAVDDLLCPPQDEHAGETGEFSRSLFS